MILQFVYNLQEQLYFFFFSPTSDIEEKKKYPVSIVEFGFWLAIFFDNVSPFVNEIYGAGISLHINFEI